MSKARYIPNRSFEREQEAEAMTRQALGLVADEIAKRAASSAPSGFMGLRGSIRSGAEGRDAAVFAGPGWHLVEFGSANSSPRAIFRRAAQGLGIGLKGSR